MWDKRMHQVMKKCGFIPLEGSPGFFYHPTKGVEMVVYVDDFVLIAPPHIEDEIWSELDKHILFKDPKEELNRFLGVYHHISYGKDGLMTMRREGIKYLMAVVKKYMQEA